MTMDIYIKRIAILLYMLWYMCILPCGALYSPVTDIITNRFHRFSVKRPERRSQAIQCGVKCAAGKVTSSNSSLPCFGYEVAPDPPQCRYIRNDNASTVCAASNMPCYASLQQYPRPSNPEGCVESIRSATDNTVVYLSFLGQDTIPIYFPVIANILQDNRHRTKRRSSYYPGFPADIRDIYLTSWNPQTRNTYAVVIHGRGLVSVYVWYTTEYVYVLGSKKTVQEEYGSSVPNNIDAGDQQYGQQLLYLVSGDDVYELRVDSNPPSGSYTLVRSFTLMTTFYNPFPPVGGEVPRLINALLIRADVLIAMAAHNMHTYNRTTREWINHGPATCVTD